MNGTKKMGESSQIIDHGDICELMESAACEVSLLPHKACVDVELNNIINMLFFFQAKGRIVVVPGNVFCHLYQVLQSLTLPS